MGQRKIHQPYELYETISISSILLGVGSVVFWFNCDLSFLAFKSPNKHFGNFSVIILCEWDEELHSFED